jgi:hypothetical protein
MFGDRHPLDIERYAEAHLQFVLAAIAPSATVATHATAPTTSSVPAAESAD